LPEEHREYVHSSDNFLDEEQQKWKRRSGAVAVAESGLLGQYGKSASRSIPYNITTVEKGDSAALLVERYALQSGARELMPLEAVAGCLRRRQAQRDTVDVWVSPGRDRACYGGLQTCASVWMCPVCAVKITERRRKELTAALMAAKVLGLVAVMVTYTLRHRAEDNLEWLLEGLMLARKKATGGRAAKLLREYLGVVGSIRALEVTWGEKSGWHPHVHDLLFVQDGVDLDVLVAGLKERWDVGVRLAGMRDVNEHGCDVTVADIDIAAYVAKFAHERGWNIEHELSKQPTKKGREGRFTPTELLRASALDGNAAAGRLWQEYAAAFKGSRQLYWSPGLRQLLCPAVAEVSDQELAAEVDESWSVLARLPLLSWKAILWNNKRAEALNAAVAGGLDGLTSFVDALPPAPVQTNRCDRITKMRSREVSDERYELERYAAGEGLTVPELRQWRRGGIDAIALPALDCAADVRNRRAASGSSRSGVNKHKRKEVKPLCQEGVPIPLLLLSL
jgi:hypothetical protein